MHKFPIDSFVKHVTNDHLVLRVIGELTSVPDGGPSLYECPPVTAATSKYIEGDLVACDPPEGYFD